MIRPDMAQIDFDTHQDRIARNVRRLLCAFAVCITLAVCAGVLIGWIVWGAI